MRKFYPIAVGLLCCLQVSVYAHDSTKIVGAQRYCKTVSKKALKVGNQLHDRSIENLDRYISKIEKLEKKVAFVHPQTAQHVFPPLIARAKAFRAQIESAANTPKQYFGYLDTLQASVDYLGTQANNSVGTYNRVKEGVERLENGVSLTEQTTALIEDGKREIAAVLEPLGGFTKELSGLQMDLFYYLKQVDEYKAMLSDPKKIEQKLLSLLSKSGTFQSFMSRNSLFAGMLGLPADYNSTRTLEDLQTRAMVDPVLQQGIGSDASLATSRIEAGSTRYENYRSGTYQTGNVDQSASEKVKDLKTLSFRRRLSYGGNIRFERANVYFPSVAELSGKIGYRFHTKGTVGLGLNYLLGMGRGWDHIALSHHGIGLRSYLDWQIRGNIYLTGGGEMNKLSGFHRLRELYDWEGYQTALLLGIMKKVKLKGSKSFTTSILYDFFASRTLSKPLQIRFGYNLK